MFISQKSEGVHPYLLICCRGTCSFVGMLKGYMIRKRLGTPDLRHCLKVTVGLYDLQAEPERFQCFTFSKCVRLLL